MIACSQCGAGPELRLDEARGLRMYACPGCRHHGGAYRCSSYAVASWALVNDPDLSRHACKAASAPKFFQRSGAWGIRCACGVNVAGLATLEGARAAWERELRP